VSDQQQSSGGVGLGEQLEHARQKVMSSEAVQRVVHHEAVQRVVHSEPVRTVQQQIQSQGPELVELVKSLAAESMVRRISIQQEGRVLFEFPLALGLGGALLAPQLAALGALAALIGNCTITVERDDSASQGGPSASTSSTGGTSENVSPPSGG
jgi:hypothetical protein